MLIWFLKFHALSRRRCPRTLLHTLTFGPAIVRHSLIVLQTPPLASLGGLSAYFRILFETHFFAFYSQQQSSLPLLFFLGTL